MAAVQGILYKHCSGCHAHVCKSSMQASLLFGMGLVHVQLNILNMNAYAHATEETVAMW